MASVSSRIKDSQLLLKLEILLPNDPERKELKAVLESYIERKSPVEDLVTCLRHIVNVPERLPMFDDIRPFVRNEHQMKYNVSIPYFRTRLRQVHLKRRGNAPLGFTIRGGCEYGTGVFISEVDSGSEGERKGLRVGDQIVGINGYGIEQAIHDEVIMLLRENSYIVLKIKTFTDTSWKNYTPSLMSHFDSKSSRRSSVRRSSNLKHSNSVPLLDEQTFPEPLSISKDSQSSVGSETPKIEDSDVYQRSVSVPVGLNDTLGQVLPIHADSPARERALPYTSEETLGAIGYQKNYHTAQMSTYQRLALESKPIDGEKAPPSCSLTETKADGDENVNKPVNFYLDSEQEETEGSIDTKICISSIGTTGVGWSLMKGPSEVRGIFVGSVEAGSLADKAGIKIGDQITAMNNHNVFNAELSKVLDLVRSTNTMELVVKRGAGIDLFPEAKANRRKLASSSLLPMVFEEDAGLQTEKVKSDLEENDNHQIQSTPLVETETLKEELPKEMVGLNQKTTKENELPKSEGKSRFCTNISLDQRDPGKVQDHQQTETRRKLREDIINSGQQYKEKTADNEITNQPRNFSKSGYLPSPTIRPHAFISRVSSQPYSESSQGHRIMSVVSRKSSASGSDMEPFYYYSYQTKRSPSLTSKGTSSVELCGDDETPITDSRGPQPKIPEIYFDEGARKPLVTIDTFRPQNRFISQEKPQNRETKSDETAPLAEMLNRSVTRPEVKPTTEEELNMNVNFDSNHPGSNTETKSEPGVVNTTVDKPPLAPSTGKNLPSQSLSVSEPDLSSPKDSVNSGKIQSLISRTPEEDCKLNMNKLSPTSPPVFWNSLLEQTYNKQQKKREFPKSSVAAPNLTVSLKKSPLYQNQISNSDSNLFKKTINPLPQGVLRYSVSVEKNLNFNVHANPSVLSVKSPVVKNSQKFLTVDNRKMYVEKPSFYRTKEETLNAQKNTNPKDLINQEETGGQEVKVLIVEKKGPINISLKKSADLSNECKILVSEIWPGETIPLDGELQKEDEILMIDNIPLQRKSLTLANAALRNAMCNSSNYVEIVFLKRN